MAAGRRRVSGRLQGVLFEHWLSTVSAAGFGRPAVARPEAQRLSKTEVGGTRTKREQATVNRLTRLKGIRRYEIELVNGIVGLRTRQAGC